MAAGSIPAAPEIPPTVANRTRRPIEDLVTALILLPPSTRRKHAAADIMEAMFYSCCHTNTDCNIHTLQYAASVGYSRITDISAGSVERFGLRRRRFSISVYI
jgi:hypothetical protein